MSILLMASDLNIPNLSLRARSRHTLVLAQSHTFHTIDFRTLYTAVQLVEQMRTRPAACP